MKERKITIYYGDGSNYRLCTWGDSVAVDHNGQWLLFKEDKLVAIVCPAPKMVVILGEEDR